jgi:hypothetical protein
MAKKNPHKGLHKKHECPTGKRRFKDHRQAVDALHGAQSARQRALHDNVETTRAEVRTYSCGLCKGHHLTSQQEWGRAA